MGLGKGERIGPYEIETPLGAGGMGEVYRARDTRLDRTVAIKVLPEHLSQDPARRERFEREARAVSSLNHPHICTLHDVGEHEGVHFLVMEHIEGETLSDRLKKGALPFDQALEYGIQIADALDKAHRAGIVQLRRVSSTDGSVEDLTSLRSEGGHAWPDVLPGGQAVLYAAWRGGRVEDGSIVVESLDTGERRTLLQGVFARYVPSGHLVYVREQNVLSAVPFDLETLAVTEPGAPVISDVLFTSAWAPDLAFSERGELVYVAGLSAMRRSLQMTHHRELRSDAYTGVRASRDGERLVLTVLHDLAEVWVYDLPRDTRTRIPVGDDAHAPIWTPDESRIVFTVNRDGKHNLHVVAVDGSGEAERLTVSPNQQIPGSISPDETVLAFSQGRGDKRPGDIYLLPFDSTGDATPFLATDASEYAPMFSPDGRWLAYVSDELYDVLPDGSFVVIRETDASSIDVRFVTNWFEELKRLAPPDP